MKLVAATAVIWAVIAIVWWLTVGAEVARATPPYKPPTLPWVQKAAAFYGGGTPVTFSVDPRGPFNATAGVAGSGQVALGQSLWESLAAFDKHVKAAKRGNKDAAQNAAVLGANGLSVLLHELVHSRPDGSNQGTGFRGWADEKQAAALGAELVPDLLQRFFGIKIGSPLSRKIAHAAKTRSEYSTVYPDDQYR